MIVNASAPRANCHANCVVVEPASIISTWPLVTSEAASVAMRERSSTVDCSRSNIDGCTPIGWATTTPCARLTKARLLKERSEERRDGEEGGGTVRLRWWAG